MRNTDNKHYILMNRAVKVGKRLKLVSLIIIFPIFFIACKKEEIKYEKLYMKGWGIYDELFSEYISEYEKIDCRRCSPGDTLKFAGLKNDHLWMCMIERNGKKKLFEWEDSDVTEKNQKKFLYNGEYGEYILNGVKISNLSKKDNGFIAIVIFCDKDENTCFPSPCIFYNGTSEKKVSYTGGGVLNWYEGTFFLSGCCYDNDGDLIYDTYDQGKENKTILPHQRIIPVSLEDGIFVYPGDMSRYNYKEQKFIWKSFLKSPFPLYGYRQNLTILDQSTSEWKLKLTVTFEDNSQSFFVYTVNIDTGLVLEQ
ncbi:hypothetical protein [Coprobacter tertius]|uniref:Lipoprotein n=1 Tax=Coprobacter tertius TaxID=2944915 RepID=A0ABT1MET2_9BACT|nr:hypothetical protein [Coprobacter tertius]MCP9611142.1 hypothetical protein [Coprobacter tertius]